jgi:YidC/Oxa1 family membrane protein insertase
MINWYPFRLSKTIFITAVGKLVVLPLEIMALRGIEAQKELQTALMRLQKQYGADREKLAQKQMELYQSARVNPLTGCLPLFPQMLIASALWIAIQNMIMHSLQVDTTFLWIPALATCEPSRWCDANYSVLIYPIPVLILLFIITNWNAKKIKVANSGTEFDPNVTRHIANIFTIVTALMLTAMPSAIVLYLVLQRWFGILSMRIPISQKSKPSRVDTYIGY